MALLARCLTAAALATIAASNALAATIDVFPAPPDNVFGDENVLFTSTKSLLPQSTVYGKTNQTGTLVAFSSSEALAIQGGGQARIVGADGSFTDMTIALVEDDLYFKSLIFNLDVVNKQKSPQVKMTLNLVDAAGHTSTDSEEFDVSANGKNFFRVLAGTGEMIDSVSFTSAFDGSTFALSDLQQVRVGPGQATVVPLPAAALPGSAMLAVGAVVRTIRRRRTWLA